MIPRRTVGEWITVANIAKDIKTLFLEGATDARLLAGAAGLPPDTDFRSADEIDLDVLDGDAFLGGNKKKVVELSRAARDGLARDNLKCLVDSDFGRLFACVEPNEVLHVTDYANLVVGSFNRDWFQMLLLRAYGGVLSDAIWERFCDGLTFCFFARYISAVSKRPAACPDVAGFVVADRLGPRLDRVDFLRSFLGVNRHSPEIQEVEDRIVELRHWAEGDLRYFVNSNDLISLLYGFLRRTGRISGATPRESVKAAVLGSLPHDLDNQETVTRLLNWINQRGCA